ncbi:MULTISPECIES: FadR/GntR family transcriptional regulator [unclassified Streptomyces]|uniref:FadR/GntR family transcriptional regulator n=1 Tax=unclassified Streptomyces TaxID=2593676 RepID=UPI003451CC49
MSGWTEDERDGGLGRVLRPVRGGNGFEEALEQVLQVLRLGLVAPGERLPPERELAARLGVSRATLREVVSVLHTEGLVDSRRGRYGGTFVRAGARAPRSAGVDLEDVLAHREVLETGTAELCARRAADPEHGPALRAWLSASLAALDSAPLEPVAAYRREDTLLHLGLAERTGSASLAASYASVRAAVNELLDRIPLLVRGLEHSQAQHTALARAILAGDADGARERMREHCAGTAALLRGFLS